MNNTRNINSKRIQVWRDTRRASEAMSAPPVSIKFKYDCDLVLPAVCAKSTISVHDMDAIDLSFLFPNSLILNLADNLWLPS
jgi:hypothetical protein